MSDFKADFSKHMKAAGDSAAAGNHRQAQHHLGHALRASQGIAKGGQQQPGVGSTTDAALNPTPVGDDDMMVQRGFGPGKQFGRGSGTGTPKPAQTAAPQKKSLRGILAGLRGK